jgi:very-short-patch-repair endonuclease
VVPQFDVHGPDGCWVARVDLALPGLRIAIEYDGREVHDRPDVFVHDRRRQNALVGAGWTVLRFSAADLTSPERIVATVAQVAGGYWASRTA